MNEDRYAISDFRSPSSATALCLLPSAFSNLHRLEQTPRLVQRLLILACWIAVRHDPRPGLDITLPILDHHRPQRDAGVHVPAKIDVPDRSGVRPAALRLDLVDDLHR